MPQIKLEDQMNTSGGYSADKKDKHEMDNTMLQKNHERRNTTRWEKNKDHTNI